MKVKIKEFSVEMDVKSAGIEFEVRTPNGARHIGDCYLTNTGLIWCAGRTTKENGVKVSWDDFIAIMLSGRVKNSAVKKAKEVAKFWTEPPDRELVPATP